MKIGFGSARRAAAATLALAGLVFLTGPLHVRNEMISTAAHADEIRKTGNVCNWDNLDWDEMSSAEKAPGKLSGGPALCGCASPQEPIRRPRARPDSDNYEAASSAKDWDELTPNERNAAQWLGYDAQNWETSCR